MKNRLKHFVLWSLNTTLLTVWSSTAIQIAHSTEPLDWQAPVQSRLKDIYELGAWRARPLVAQWLPDSSGYSLTPSPANAGSTQAFYETESGELLEPPKVSLPDPLKSPDGKFLLENRGTSLWLSELPGGTRRRFAQTSDGQEIFYHGTSWSPDGSSILFIESNEADIKKRSILAPTDPSYPEVRENRFARVGEAIPKLRVGVADALKNETKWLAIPEPSEGFYLGQVEWAGNDQQVLVETLSRFREKREFFLIDVASNHATRIYSETNDAWADASQGTNQGLIWLRDGQQFIVISEKDGWRQAFLYWRDGREIAKLTPGDYDIIARGPVDEMRGCFYFSASPHNATQKYLYRVPLSGEGTLEQVTPNNQPGTHDYVFSPNAKWAFHTYSTFDIPPVTELVELKTHRRLRVLEDNAELRQRASLLATNPTEFLQLDVGNGVIMDAWLIKPSDFDPAKKYPLFIYVYGEPHSQTVLDGWAKVHDQFHRTVADLGYVVVSIDNRGTPSPKGAAWRRSVFGSLGPLSTEDQAAALQKLARTREYIDLSRVGIWGWSGGGSNTLNAMFRKPDLYHVGIAVVPKPQPHLYNAWFQEIYMRTREVNPEGYQQSAAINYAEGLRGKLLIITGSGETNTHIQIIEGLVDRLIELGKPFDYMVYPNRDHGLQEGAGTVVHVRMLIIRYLVDNLPRGGR